MGADKNADKPFKATASDPGEKDKMNEMLDKEEVEVKPYTPDSSGSSSN